MAKQNEPAPEIPAAAAAVVTGEVDPQDVGKSVAAAKRKPAAPAAPPPDPGNDDDDGAPPPAPAVDGFTAGLMATFPLFNP